MNNKQKDQFISSLLENTSFIRWVNSDFETDNDEWSEFIDEHEEEENAINEAIRLVRILKFDDVTPAVDNDRLWNRIEQSAELDKGRKSTPEKVNLYNIKRIARWAAFAAAACLILFIVFRPGLNDETHYSTARGEQTVVHLADDTEVIINSDTRLTGNIQKDKGPRIVKLSGEAYFKVSKGRKFIVETEAGKVEVLGTEFNVYARDMKLEVICYSGKVAVSFQNDEKQYPLSPGEGLKWADGNIKAVMMDLSRPAEDWRTGLFTFEKALFADVIAEFERQYPYKVNLPDAYKTKYYSGFFRSKNVEDALMSVAWPMGLKYTIRDDQVILTVE
jgi:transmembrane sensor